jgi:dihydrofolate reductase/uncharacterized protein YndB with AHSA1/START domain
VVTRTFNAPARIVFEAWTRPELMQLWWAPRSSGVPLRSCAMDVRPGGKYRLEFGDGGSRSMAFFGTYIEVTPPSRLVWTNEESEEGAVTTVTFEDVGDMTLLTLHEIYPSKEALDEAIAGMDQRLARAVRAAGRASRHPRRGGLTVMGKVCVRGFGVSIDGFGAGANQSFDHPLGERGGELMNWFYPTRYFRSMIGKEGGTEDRFADASMEGFGAFILGRNMFGPAGDDWGGPDWKGWWGEDPPYHAPTFILTHHAREPIVMEGGTTFHFVTEGIEAALAQAKAAAGDLDVKIGGGVSTVRQYLEAGLIDEMHLAISPVVLGRGEALFAGLDLPGLGYRVTETVPTDLATHLVLTR